MAVQGSTITIKGTVDIYFTNRAWEEIGYKSGNFYHFDKYWQFKKDTDSLTWASQLGWSILIGRLLDTTKTMTA